MKMTRRKIKELIREEKGASKMYIKYGYPNIAKQERSHARILSKRLK